MTVVTEKIVCQKGPRSHWWLESSLNERKSFMGLTLDVNTINVYKPVFNKKLVRLILLTRIKHIL